ncbi:sulfate permease [Vibrio ponticus]|nr:sulfate permease [Vibrio ponticus]
MEHQQTTESVATEQTHPAFSVGIDLGTTHCVMSFLDTRNEHAQVEVVAIPQLTAPGTVETRSQLGSFLYQPHEHEMDTSSRVLPWSTEPKALVGAIARNLGSKTPIRLIASAKSWLCMVVSTVVMLSFPRQPRRSRKSIATTRNRAVPRASNCRVESRSSK